MLLVTRKENQQLIIGNDTVVTMAEITGKSTARLGIDSPRRVSRVDTPEQEIEAAKIRARVKAMIGKDASNSMERLPVYIGYRTDQSGLDIRASLREEMVAINGYQTLTLSADTHTAPPGYQFLVFRCATEEDAQALQKLCDEGLVQWVFYEQIETRNGDLYALFVRKGRTDHEGDVKYSDLMIR